jgi:response regulator RpfG family c-di-GMP phosphodiesterase
MKSNMAGISGKPTLLVVDDKRANLLAFEALLGEEYQLVFAQSGKEALSLLMKQPDVDVIVLDVQMPIMDGFETAAAIKKIEVAREIPIIFVTAVYNEDPHIRRGYAVGGVDYFGKPFDPDILKLKLRIYASFRNRENILRQRELHIRESEELLRVGRKLSSVLESLSVGVLIADTEGRICQSTEEVSRIFKAIEPLANDSYGELLGWWDGDGRMIKHERGALARALAGHTSHSEPLEIKCFDGSAKNILMSASPLRGLDNRLVGAVVLIQDMTEPRRIEEALEHRVTRLISLGVELEETAVRPS